MTSIRLRELIEFLRGKYQYPRYVIIGGTIKKNWEIQVFKSDDVHSKIKKRKGLLLASFQGKVLYNKGKKGGLILWDIDTDKEITLLNRYDISYHYFVYNHIRNEVTVLQNDNNSYYLTSFNLKGDITYESKNRSEEHTSELQSLAYLV